MRLLLHTVRAKLLATGFQDCNEGARRAGFMKVQAVMPQLGLTMTEGTITEWSKKPVDTVEKNEPILLSRQIRRTWKLSQRPKGSCLKLSWRQDALLPWELF